MIPPIIKNRPICTSIERKVYVHENMSKNKGRDILGTMLAGKIEPFMKNALQPVISCNSHFLETFAGTNRWC